MREFLYMESMKNDKKINHALFDKSFDKPLHEFIVASVKNLEMIPGFKLDSWELITDQSVVKRETIIDKERSKNRKIRRQKRLRRLISDHGTLCDLLLLHFLVTVKGETVKVTRKLLVFKELPGHYYMIGGKKVSVINQIVDASTLHILIDDKKHPRQILKLKTVQNYTVDIELVPYTLYDFEGKKYKIEQFVINLFAKETNPIIYYFAKFGVENTIRFMQLENIVSLTNTIQNPELFTYFEIGKDNNSVPIYLEVNRYMLKHVYIQRMIAGLTIMLGRHDNIPISKKLSKEYWLNELSVLFSGKRNLNRGKNALISFGRILDPTTKSQLMLRKYHKKDSYTLIRWVLMNYDGLLRKDHHDLKWKRLRSNECIAFFFDSTISNAIYSLLNTSNPSIEKYVSTLNSISLNMLIKSGTLRGKKSGSSYSIYHYERFNDLGGVINRSRYSLRGPNGITASKHSIKDEYKNIWPSHLGRFDINYCSSNTPGITGLLAANCKIYENGYLVPDYREPDDDSLFNMIETALRKGKIPKDYYMQSREFFYIESVKNEDGSISLKRKKNFKERIADSINSGEVNVIKVGEYVFLPSKSHLMQSLKVQTLPDGTKVCKLKRIQKDSELSYDEFGRIILRTSNPELIARLEKQRKILEEMGGYESLVSKAEEPIHDSSDDGDDCEGGISHILEFL